MTRLEWAVCLGTTLTAIGLQVIYLTHAGGLWRDETNCVHLATRYSVSETWQMLTHDSFPALFPTAIRVWAASGLGSTDFGLRCLGFVVSLLLLGAVWLNARVLTSSLPLVSTGLLAVNLTVVRWGGSLRAYGLGCFLILLTLALVWSMMRKPSAGRFWAATLAAVLSVQCLYQDSFLLFAICVAGCFVCFRCDQERTALMVVGVGALAAVSLLPYVGQITLSQRWRVVEKGGFHASIAWSNLLDALGSPMAWLAFAWIGLGFVALVRGLVFIRPSAGRKRIGAEDLPLFAAITTALGVVGFLIFLLMVELPTQPWYWLPMMAVGAICIEAALQRWLERHRGWRLALVVLIVFVPLTYGVRLARYRQTNLDLVAARLGVEAKSNDLILVYPWYNGVTFNRYYRGAAPWTTLPALSDHRIHRYDLLKETLAATAPIRPVLDRMGRTLAAGNRVWIVGDLPPPEPGEAAPPDLPPAPAGPQGWFDVPYSYVWGRQAEHFVKTHGWSVEHVPTTSGVRVSVYENVSLAVVRGPALQ